MFAALRDSGLVADDLAERLIGMAGFRNILAQGYADIDPALVYDHLTHLDDARAFVEGLSDYLKAQDAL